MHRLAYDPRRNILTIHVSGFLDPDDVPALADAIDGQLRAASAVRGDFRVLVESFDFPVQATDVADLLSQIMRDGIDLTTGHVAVVVGSQLNKLQAERTLVHPRVRIFREMDEAMRWLESGAA
ncbi:STAS/SEC14 domain-containing protein [Sphingomonas sp.]|uniref:STAS/SEC14 domain-containing protein n=1 Tax=Sphingomonas sp. TaxID=28214 RepID=UPI002DD6A5D1|nr:STAS/SEC14 domain-containing protein [Sphingomonas sp.]